MSFITQGDSKFGLVKFLIFKYSIHKILKYRGKMSVVHPNHMMEILIPPLVMQRICEYLDPLTKKSLGCTSFDFALLFRSLSQQRQADWNDWYFSLPHSFCFMTPQMPTAHLHNILGFLQPKELILLGKTCQDWKQYISYSRSNAQSKNWDANLLVT